MKKNKLFFIFLLFVELTIFSQDGNDKNIEYGKVDLIKENAYIAMSDPNYLVTAGDVYGLSYVMGGKPINVNLIVDISYNVKILNLATINVDGLTFSQFKRQAEDIVRKNYPLSGAQLIMIKPAIFTIAIKGEVSAASEVRASSLTRLSNLIGGFFTAYSSNRDIQILSISGKVKEYDLFKARRYGDFSQDPFLRPGDTVIIKRLQRQVSIGGSVERPGTYQLLENENLKELIEIYGGGLREFADITKLTITRNNKTDLHPLGNFIKIEEKEKIDSFVLENNDSIYIPNELEFKSAIILDAGSGIIKIPFTEGADLVSIVRAYRGRFDALADTKNAYLMRDDKKIYTNFNRIFYDIDYNEKIYLELGDKIVVPVLQKTVIVSGAVFKPGAYPYVPGKTYDYYIALAGGFINNQTIFSSVKIRDASGKKMNKKDHILPDSIIIASSNAFLYNAMPYVTFIASVLGIIATTVGLIFTIRGK